MVQRKVIWTTTAIKQFGTTIQFIKKQFIQNASIVKATIIAKTDELKNYWIVHRKDPLKNENDGRFFYFEILKIRIAYFVDQDKVYIIRVRHTKMEPKIY
jgi:plasmid stabilization system protein ParE